MQKLAFELNRINEFSEYDINLILEDDPPEITPTDLIPESDPNRMKILCAQLAGGDYDKFNLLYYETPIYNVYEFLTLNNAINYRVENGSNNRNDD